MSVLAVEWYLIILAMQDIGRMVTWAGHRLLSARSRAWTATVARMKRVKLRFLSLPLLLWSIPVRRIVVFRHKRTLRSQYTNMYRRHVV